MAIDHLPVGATGEFLETFKLASADHREGMFLGDAVADAARARVSKTVPDGSDWALNAYIMGTVTVTNTVNVAVSNFPASQAVTGPLTDVQLRATPVPVSGGADHALTFAGDKVDVTGSTVGIVGSVEVVNDVGNPLPVSGTVAVSNFPGSQPVTGPLTDAQLRATPVPVSGGADHALTFAGDKVDVSGSSGVGVTGPLTDAQLRATPVPVSGGADHALTFAGDKVDASGSSVSVSNFPASTEIANDVGNPIPMSAASLPLPAGAATDANLSALLGTLSTAPGANTVLERLQQIGAKIDASGKVYATEATMQKLLAALKPATKQYSTLLHGR